MPKGQRPPSLSELKTYSSYLSTFQGARRLELPGLYDGMRCVRARGQDGLKACMSVETKKSSCCCFLLVPSTLSPHIARRSATSRSGSRTLPRRCLC
jgi:hypothetical protein